MMVKKLATAVLCLALGGAVIAAGAQAAGKRPGVAKGHTAQGRSIRAAISKRSVELKHFTISCAVAAAAS